MLEKDIKEWLRPIINSVERLVPTNRALVDFTNSKASGTGVKRSLSKVKFLDKSERSTYQCIGLTMNELKKKLNERKVKEEDQQEVITRAQEVLDETKRNVERVYGEVRRYIVTSELRTGCIQHHFKKIPSISAEQNQALSKEMFSMALEFVNKSDKHSLDDVEDEFEKINRIATELFAMVEKTGGFTSTTGKSKPAHSNEKHRSPLSLLDDLW